MKYSIDRKALIDCLSVGGSMSGKSKVLPILNCCKINVKSNKLIISSYDGENAVLKSVALINHDEDFSFCVNCDDFFKAIKSLKDSTLDFELANNLIIIKHLHGFMELPYESVEDYPAIDNVSDGLVYENLPCERFWNWLNSARNFTANDTLRPILCGVHIYFMGTEYGVCASDGNAMYADSNIAPYELVSGSAVIPNAAISSVMAVLNGNDSVDIKINDRNVSFSCADARAVCRLPNGTYPNFRAVFPTSHSVTVRLSREDILASVNRARLFANNGTSLCVLETMNGELGVAAENLDFNKKSVDSCMASIQGNIRIGVKGDFIVKCLSATDSIGIIMEMTDPSRPIIFRTDDNLNLRILLMPMMINR